MKQRLMLAVGPVLMIAMGATVVASAQSSSPFANKNKKQAWETPNASAPLPTPTAATSTPPLQLRGARSPLPAPARVETPQSAPTRTPTPTPKPAAPAAQSRAEVAPTRATARAVPNIPTGETAAKPASTTVQSRGTVTAPSVSASITPPTASVTSPPRTYPSVDPNSRWALGGAYRPGGTDDTDWTVHTVPSTRPRVPQGYQGNVQIQPSGPAVNATAQARPPLAGAYPGTTGQAPASGPFARPRSAGEYGGEYGAPYPGQAVSPYGQAGGQAGAYGQGGYASGQANPNNPYPNGPYQNGPYTGGPYGAPGPNAGPPKRQGFFDRIGLGAIRTLFTGGLRGGVAARENNGWGEVFVGDADAELEVSAITQGGLEWGVHTQVRAQYDEGRKGFTRRLPDCPPTLAGCPSVLVGVTPAAVRGHTSQFYTSGPDVAKDTQVALESAHIFLRSAYGDVTLGRDDGAAFLFSLGAPSLLNVGASNSPVDYTGLDSVKTYNDASGFAEKITYTSPRLLGDQVGVGVQIGLSYAPDSDACGVDYCVDLNDITNVVAPHIEDVMEAGLALDRTFANGLSVEGTLTYARGSEQSGQAGLDDLKALGAGLELKLADWTLGGSYLNSNNGLINGDYEAYDVGLTWKPSQLGVTLGYGHATDDLVGLSSDQIVGGVSWDINERFRLGAGAQYADRDTIRQVAGTAQLGNEKATAIFIEGGFKF